jgi:hypothetical protein
MAEANIRTDKIDIIVKSKTLSVDFMNTVKNIENMLETDIPILPKQESKRGKVYMIKNIIEPNDDIFNMSDIELINQLKNYLELCYLGEIGDYYRENNIKYRTFRLTGLYSNKNGIKTDKQRKILRDMLRRCIDFTKTDFFKSKIKIHD